MLAFYQFAGAAENVIFHRRKAFLNVVSLRNGSFHVWMTLSNVCSKLRPLRFNKCDVRIWKQRARLQWHRLASVTTANDITREMLLRIVMTCKKDKNSPDQIA